MTDAPILTVLAALADVSDRQRSMRALARRLGVDEALLLVRDPEDGEVRPAPGFPASTRDDPAWRSALADWRAPGLHHTRLHGDEPGTPVVALVGADGGTLVLLGGTPTEGDLATLALAAPLLGAMVRAEADADRHAHALERSRRETARLDGELQAAGRRKEEFLAMLGHELRNPMAAITGALELMRVSPDSLEIVGRARAVIERQSQQLAHLIDDLLDVARVTRGKISLRREPTDLNDAVRRAAEGTHGLINARKHRLHVHYTAPLLAMGDPTRLEQIAANLLSNAAKYTNEGGKIEVTVAREGEDAVVRVQDNGIGIAPDLLGTIFEPFMQVSPAIDRSQGGMGIGLTLAKELATLHGGRIDATSELGQGSVFTLRVPALPADETAAAPSGAHTGPTRERRVLVVDDNVDAAEMLVELLAMWGHTAVHAADGPQALTLAPEFGPDLILLDIGLPGLDGYAVARLVRQDPTLDGAKIVAMTGYGQLEDRMRTAEAGFAAHLVKPIDFEELRGILGET